MKVLITSSDVDSGRLTKIARIISKMLRADQPLSHTAVMQLLSKSLGYGSLHDLQKSVVSSINLTQVYESRRDEFSGFIIDVQISPGVGEIYKQCSDVFSELISYNFDDFFQTIDLRRLDFFNLSKSGISLNPETLSRIHFDFTKRLNKGLDGIFEYKLADKSLVRDSFLLLKNYSGQKRSKIMSTVTIGDFLKTEINLTADDGSILSGGFYDLMFLKTFRTLLRDSIYMVAFELGVRPSLSSDDYASILNLELKAYKEGNFHLPVMDIFKRQRIHQGMFSDADAYGNEFKKTKKIKVNSQFHQCYIELSMDTATSDDELVEGQYWKCSAYDKKGALQCFITGGLYRCDDVGYPEKFDMPFFDDAEIDVEHDFIFELASKALKNRRMARRLYTHLTNGRVLTVSSVERNVNCEKGNGLVLLRHLFRTMSDKYDLSAVYFNCKPLQYLDWHPDNQFKPVADSKKYDISKIHGYFERGLSDIKNLVLHKPI